MSRNRLLATTFALGLAAVAFAPQAKADEIADTIRSALEAYETGDIQFAQDELQFALQLLGERKAGAFTDLLPEPLPGWTRETSTEAAMAMAMFGGGISAEGTYRRNGESFTITLMADNPIVASMGAMMGNPAVFGGSVVRVGRERFMSRDNELTGLIGNRVLVRVEGNAPDDVKIEHLRTMDFRAIADF